MCKEKNTNRSVDRRLPLCLILTAAIILAIANSAAAEEQEGVLTIRLLPEVTLNGSETSEVKLSQIAELAGPERQVASIGEHVVASKLSASSSTLIRAWKISEELSAAGVDVTKIVFKGSAGCRLRTVVPQVQDEPAKNTLSSDPLRVSAKAITLETKLRKLICDQLKSLPAASRVQITFNPTVQPILELTEPAYTFNITPKDHDGPCVGLVGFDVELSKSGQKPKIVSVLAQVEVEAPLLAPVRQINSKEELEKNDVEVVWRKIGRDEMKNSYVTDLNVIEGQRAKRIIPAGTPLVAGVLESMPLVKRGQLITVIYRSGGLELRTVGQAQETGCRDQLIMVRNERSGQTFRAKVDRSGIVLVEAPAAMAEVSLAEADVKAYEGSRP